jgi:uncharacterized repeat protein (TIGR01451 family)
MPAFGQSSSSGGTVTISDKINNSTDSLHPNGPVLSGYIFTYRLAYSYSGWAPGDLKLIQIQDIVPPQLAIWSVSNPSGTVSITGNIVRFNVTTGLGGSCGAGTVDINVYFRNDSTCNGTRVCNGEVSIRDSSISKKMSAWSNPRVSSCAIDSASNNWSISKRHIICSYGDSVLYQIGLQNSRQLGSLELRNVVLTDVLPPGATMGAVVSSGVNTWTAVTGTSGTVTFTGGPTTCGSQLGWYYVNFWVHYPLGTFTAGQLVNNSTNCSFSLPCDTSRRVMKNGDQTALCDFLNDGVMAKNFSLNLFYPTNPWSTPSVAPGCCGVYAVKYTNTGTVRQTPVTLIDDLPSTLDVNAVDVPVPAGMTATMQWKNATDANWIPASPAVHSSVWTESGFPGLVGQMRHLQVTYTATNSTAFAQGASLTTYIHVCFDASLTTQNVVNVANIDAVAGTNHFTHTITSTLSPDPLGPKIIARKFFIGNCPNGPNGPWYPGNTVRWRIAIANVGNQDVSTLHLQDVLPTGMTYAGGAKYEAYSTMLYPGVGWNTPSCSDPSLMSTVPTLAGVATTVPAIGDATLNWQFTKLVHNCTGTVDWLIIDFDVKISDNPMMLAGTYPNNYKFTGSNLTGVDSSNYAYVTINTVTRAEATKLVSASQSGPFTDHANIPAGGTGYYQLTVKNTGNVPLLNLSLLDILPHTPGDIGPISALPRGSLFNVLTNGTITATTGWTPGYSTPSNVNPDRQAGFLHFCGIPNPPGTTVATWLPTPSATGSFVVSGASLPPAQTLTVVVPFVTNANAHSGDTACNSFAWQAQAGGTIGLAACMFAESGPACITSGAPCPCPCDTGKMSVALNHNADLQFDWKVFTIFNLHCTPIDSINLKYYDGTTGALLASAPPIGGSLVVYRNPSGIYSQGFTTFNNGDNYHHIPLPAGTTLAKYGTPATQDRVSFELGLNVISNPAKWKVVATVYHPNGDTCHVEFPLWTPIVPTTGTGGGPGRLTGHLYAVPIDINPNVFKPIVLGYVSATLTNDSAVIVGATTAAWENDTLADTHQLQKVEQTSSGVLFTLSPNASDLAGTLHLVAFVRTKDTTPKATPPVLNFTLFDDSSNKLSVIKIQVSQTLAVAEPPKGEAMPTNGLVITSVKPNPARNVIEVQYRLDATEDMQLELYNTLGVQVGMLAQGYETRGEHTAQYVVGGLPEGSYYLRLSTRFGQASSSMRIVR